jgi:formylglycine-generating enzyme required for sulfatase activity
MSMTNNWAIVVGINEYKFLPEASLKFAEQDAIAMQHFLCEDAKFADRQVMLCVDKSANRSELRHVLLNKLKQAQGAENLWFFFSGHGIVGTDNQDYLMTSDGNPDDLEDTAISINFVTDNLRASKAKNIILVLDMCRNESRESGQKSVESMETSLRQLVEQREGQQGIITLFSCKRGESSYEIPGLGQGAFTYALLEGLRQSTILEDLEKHLELRVPELHQLEGRGRKQVPVVISEPAWRYGNPILNHHGTVKDVSKLILLAIDAEGCGELERAIQLWDQVNLLATDSINRSRALTASKRLQKQVDLLAINSDNRSRASNAPIRSVALTSKKQSPKKINPPTIAPRKLSIQTVSKPLVLEFASVNLDSKGNIIDRPEYRAEYFVEDLGHEVSLTMVKIPAGEFLMGSPISELGRSKIESPQHRVRVPEFYMGQTLVTQSQWQQVMGNNPSQFNGEGKLPVEKISWLGTQEFLQKLSQQAQRKYRLPSEAEWEYACRSGSITPFSFGETISCEIANYCAQDRTFNSKNYMGNYGDGKLGEFRNKTTYVDNFPPNAFGLYDMHGNLYEWCLDHWHLNYENAPSDGSAWLSDDDNSHRVRRGGSYNYDPLQCRSANRHCNAPSIKFTNCGFRVVCEVPRI